MYANVISYSQKLQGIWHYVNISHRNIHKQKKND